jgi:hypothetical protein
MLTDRFGDLNAGRGVELSIPENRYGGSAGGVGEVQQLTLLNVVKHSGNLRIRRPESGAPSKETS